MAADRERSVQARRIYDEPHVSDGARILVDRLWPRGISKANAHVDRWCKEVAPSTPLRQWYNHDLARYVEFRDRYRAELREPARREIIRALVETADAHMLTLLTATRQLDLSAALILAQVVLADDDPRSSPRDG